MEGADPFYDVLATYLRYEMGDAQLGVDKIGE
jgi:hypothetical protein